MSSFLRVYLKVSNSQWSRFAAWPEDDLFRSHVEDAFRFIVCLTYLSSRQRLPDLNICLKVTIKCCTSFPVCISSYSHWKFACHETHANIEADSLASYQCMMCSWFGHYQFIVALLICQATWISKIRKLHLHLIMHTGNTRNPWMHINISLLYSV